MALQHAEQVPQANVATRHSAFKRAFEHRLQAFGEFLLNFWAVILTTLLGLLLAIAIAIPILSYLGLDIISKPLFYTLHVVCAQVPSHSFFLFGHQLGLCARNFAIYASMFIGTLVFVLTKKRLPGIPWWLWGLLLLPMALDGFTQMFGLRESTWELRVITGTLFGLANVWFVLPLIQKTLAETADYDEQKRAYQAALQQHSAVNS